MVRPDGRVKVLDFGLARRLGGENEKRSATTVSDVFAGTWRYMSPEQVMGETLTGASDVFALGLVLYELAAGRHPFQAASPFETLQAIAGEEAVPPSKLNPQLSESFESLILGMLAKDPAARPAARTIADVLAEWDTGRVDSHAQDAFRLPRTRRTKALIVVSVVLLAVLAAILWLLLRPQNHRPGLYQVTSLVPENRATAAAISPDGVYTAYANVDGIFVRTNQTGETDPLRAPKDFLVDQLLWSVGGTSWLPAGFPQLPTNTVSGPSP